MSSMDRQSPQMEAAFRLLQQVWVMELPVHPDEEAGEEVESAGYCQVIVVALRWTARFGTAPAQAVIAVPADATTEFQDSIEMPVYLPDEAQSVGECSVCLVVVPGALVWERLVESVPVDSPCLPSTSNRR
eukprot:3613646-Amphidinium_carterae.1